MTGPSTQPAPSDRPVTTTGSIGGVPFCREGRLAAPDPPSTGAMKCNNPLAKRAIVPPAAQGRRQVCVGTGAQMRPHVLGNR